MLNHLPTKQVSVDGVIVHEELVCSLPIYLHIMGFRFRDRSPSSTKCVSEFGTVLISCRFTHAILPAFQVTFELSNKSLSDVVHKV